MSPSPDPTRSKLPEEIGAAIKVFQDATKALALGYSNPGRVRTVRATLTAAILSRLNAVEAERDAALARVERTEKALEPFADFVSTIELRANDGLPISIGGYGTHRKVLTVGDVRAAREALASPVLVEETRL